MANLYKNLPPAPGVYLMKDRSGRLLYVGKAANLRRRVSAYFLGRGHKPEEMVDKVAKVDYRRTETALEALILEAQLIKKFRPPYNVREADDRSFLYVEITREKFPRVLLVRGKSVPQGERFGPFTSGSSIRQALKIIRKIFPFSIHPAGRIGKFPRPCFDCEIGLCPGTCVSAIAPEKYRKNIRGVRLILSGRKKRLLADLEKEMKKTAARLDFEEAEKIRKQIFSLKHIQDVALLGDAEGIKGGSGAGRSRRVEAYDISNISGTAATGAMVVLENGGLSRNEYRRFKIRTIEQSDDTGMMKEMLDRRLKNDWPLPDLILVDGGLGQMAAVRKALDEAGLKIPIIGIAKGPERKADRFIGRLPEGIDKRDLLKLRDEAHRFAISYHKKLRNANLLK